MSASRTDRTVFFDLVSQLRSRWAVVVGGGLIGLLAGAGAPQLSGVQVANQTAAASVSVVVLLIGAAAGLGVGFLAGLVLVRLQPRITTADDVRRVTGLPVVGQLPSSNVGGDDLDDRHSAGLATSLREAVMNTRALAGGRLPTRLVLARTDGPEESTGVDGGIARALVESGFVPAVVQTDFESPMAGEGPGADLAADDFTVGRAARGDAAAYQRIRVPDRVTASGPKNRAREVEGLFASLGERYDVTVAQASSNSFPLPLRALAPGADAVVLVVRSNRTTIASLLALHGELLALGTEPLGVVMTSVAARHRVLLRRTWLATDFRSAPSAPVTGETPVERTKVPVPRRSGFSISDLATLAAETVVTPTVQIAQQAAPREDQS